MGTGTLAGRIWDQHVVGPGDGTEDLLYLDLHLLHEVNTPRAFDALRAGGHRVRRPDLTLAVEDHNTPTRSLDRSLGDPAGRYQAATIRRNCEEFGIPLLRLGDAGQGIVHVVAPEQGLIHPGSTVVCCDSHTTTLGAFGALAFGIGTAQVAHVLATQSLPMTRPADLAVTVDGVLPAGTSAKDLALTLIARIGTGGAQGHVVEYRGEAVRALSMEGRMTLCNLTVEAGSRAGLVAPDRTTVKYLRGRRGVPAGEAFEAEAEHWLSLARPEPGVEPRFDREVVLDAADVRPFVTWGTNPAQAVPLTGVVPDPQGLPDQRQQAAAVRALEYMGLAPGTPLRTVPVDTVFVGSCANGRIEDLREVAAVLRDRRVSTGVRMMIVPGSAAVRRQAVAEGLDDVFAAAGADFRALPGCSMCCALNEDRLGAGQRAASTTNRNFEGRQGKGARTHVVSPAVAAATAVAGRLTAPADL